MPKPDYRHFLAILENKDEQTAPSLFAPFIDDTLTEQLIWRRGPQLWDTPEHYTDTMISLRERTRADVIILDSRRFCRTECSRMLAAAEEHCPDGAAFVVLCQNPETQRIAESSPVVCAVGGYEDCCPRTKPFIRMDRTPEEAIAEGAAAWFAPDHAQEYYNRYHDTLTVAAGLGAPWCAESEPLAIHRAAEQMMEHTHNQGWLLGSGGTIPANAYLSLISLLGIYGRYR
ncbi:MAG: hypothetical protein IJ449_10230 [Clostridia bacterium]|nr:hypothetical protein [Clostridia bacterium]